MHRFIFLLICGLKVLVFPFLTFIPFCSLHIFLFYLFLSFILFCILHFYLILFYSTLHTFFHTFFCYILYKFNLDPLRVLGSAWSHNHYYKMYFLHGSNTVDQSEARIRKSIYISCHLCGKSHSTCT